MSMKYDLVIFCAFLALAIMRIAYQRRKLHKLRQRQKWINTANFDLLVKDMLSRQADLDSQRKSPGKPAFDIDMLIICLAVVGLAWSGARIWMEN